MSGEDQWTDKEAEEQNYVTDFIEKSLVDLNLKNIHKQGPEVVQYGPVEHLRTMFNFSVELNDQVKLIEKFARELLKKRTGESGGVGADFFSSLPSLSAFAERAVKAAGLEFVPTPKETLERARTRFVSRRTRLIKFKNDDLDQNRELMEALEMRFKVYPGRVDARELDFGNHLTPVYFSLDGLKLSPALEKLVGQFSLGDEEGVKRLADEFSAFIREK